MAEPKAVRLSDIKFAKPNPPPQPDPKLNNTQPDPAPAYPINNQTLFSNPHLKPFERLAADKPGEELAPEGVIWQMYAEEAKEHDSELVESENNNLDMMLLFAALFSAILTSFIIESKNLLQEDSADVTIKLLLSIAQSQCEVRGTSESNARVSAMSRLSRRIELGSSETSPPIERPSLYPSASARCVNGLWFTSLALSLSAALVAMLAKEWLTAFTASRPRPAHIHALEHQARLQGLATWRALHIINLLPTMLHISLLLFSLGLAVYLWTLDSGIAIAEVLIAAGTVFFYCGTALVGALRNSCPFITQISKYLRVILEPPLRVTGIPTYQISSFKIQPGQKTSESELQALVWLTENARGPAIGDCACQALAGFRNRNAQSLISHPDTRSTQDTGEEPSSIKTNASIMTDKEVGDKGLDESLDDQLPLTQSRYELIKSLFDTVYMRFSQARLRLPQESTENSGMYMARYASLMPTLVYALEEDKSVVVATAKNSRPKIKRVSDTAAVSALRALDSVWTNQFPELSPDSYATLTAAELRLSRLGTHTYLPKDFSHPAPLVGSTVTGHTTVSIQPNNGGSTPLDKSPLFKLRARYSRGLSRAGYLLRYHNTFNQSISSRPLVYLLLAIREAAMCAELNPETHMSTCLPQPKAANQLPEFQVEVASTGLSHWVKPLHIGDKAGIIAGLVQVLSTAGVEGNSPVELAAGNCLAVVCPMLFKQWAHMISQHPDYQQERYTGVGPLIESLLSQYWPKDREIDELEGVVDWAMTQLLVVTAISLGLAALPQMSHLPKIATAALCRRVQTEPGRKALARMLVANANILSQAIVFVESNQNNIRPDILHLLLELFSTQHPDVGDRSLAAPLSSLPHLLRLLSGISHSPETVHLVLKEIQDETRGEHSYIILPTPYLNPFLEEPEGFASLASIAQLNEYASAVVDAITNIVQDAAARSWRRPLKEPAVLGLLSAVQVVIEGVTSGTKEMVILDSFMDDIMSIVRPLDRTEKITAIHRPAITTIYQSLKRLPATSQSLQDTISELEDWTDADDGLLRDLSRLFDVE